MSQRNQTYATDPLGSTTSSSGITGYPTTSAPGTTTYTSTTGYETAPGMAGTGTGYRSTEYSSTGPSTMGSAVGYEATSASGVGSGMMAGHHEGEIKPSTVGGAWDKTVGGMKVGWFGTGASIR